MLTVITTRDIPTFAGVIRAGVLLSVVSWGENGAANLVGLNGWPRVSMARAESFEVADADAGDQPSAVSGQPLAISQQLVHSISSIRSNDDERSNYEQLAAITDTSPDADRGDSDAAQSRRGEGPRDDGEACPFEPTRVSAVPGHEVSPHHRASGVDRTVLPSARTVLSDINAELAAGGSGERYQLTNEMREQARFARPESRRSGFDWGYLPQGSMTPELLLIVTDREDVGMPTFPRSSWHPRRHEWPEPWRIAEYGLTAMGRVFWSADHPDIRPDGHAWRLAIDLDRGEVCVGGQWQRMETTTEARRHGVEDRVPDKSGGDAGKPVPERRSQDLSGPPSSPATSMSQPTALSCEIQEGDHSLSVSPCLRGSTSGHQPSAISQWPEPHDGMTIDERRGHRRVKNEQGDIVWRCGPGPRETLADFLAWRRRLDAYFEQQPSKETKEGAA